MNTIKRETTHGSIEWDPADGTGLMTLRGLRSKYETNGVFTSLENILDAAIEGTFNRVQDRLGEKGITRDEILRRANDVLERIGNGTYVARTGGGDPVETEVKRRARVAANRKLGRGADSGSINAYMAKYLEAHGDRIRERVREDLALEADLDIEV